METIKINRLKPEKGIIKKAVQVLRTGGIIAHSTDTCYGLACDPENQETVLKLCAMKKRETEKPLSLMVADKQMLWKYALPSEVAQKIVSKFLPGALTIVLPRTPAVPPWINPGQNSIGLRMPADKISRALIYSFGRALITTSANIAEGENLYSGEDVERIFIVGNRHACSSLQPDLILDAGKFPKIPPSTIVDLTQKEPQILRQGNLKLDFSPKQKHVPLRTCLACRKHFEYRANHDLPLLKITRLKNGSLVVNSRTVHGRSVYLCQKPECLAWLSGPKAKGVIERGLRIKLSTEEWKNLKS